PLSRSIDAPPTGPGPVAVSPNGTRLCVQTPGERIAVFDATSGKQTAVCDVHDDAIWDFRFSPDSSRLATVGEDRTARVWDAATGPLLATCRGHTSKVLRSAFSPDGCTRPANHAGSRGWCASRPVPARACPVHFLW